MGYDANEFTPIDIISQGNLSASIYRCRGQKGIYYSTEINHFYYSGRTLKRTDTYRDCDLLPLSNLAIRAYNRICSLKADDQASRLAPAAHA